MMRQRTCEGLRPLGCQLAIAHDGLHLMPERLLRQALVHLAQQRRGRLSSGSQHSLGF